MCKFLCISERTLERIRFQIGVLSQSLFQLCQKMLLLGCLAQSESLAYIEIELRILVLPRILGFFFL
jgi:hypothetical protein